MTENRIRHVQLPTFRIIVHNFANGCINRQNKFDRSLPPCKNFSVTFPMKTVCDTTAIRIWRYTQYVAAAVTTLADAILWINEVASIWIFAIFFWLFLTAGIVSIVSFFVSLRCNTQHRRILLIWHCVNILVFVLWYVNPNDRCNADIMERHYEKYHTQMDGLHRYVIDQLNPGCSIDLEFEHGRITIFHVKFQTGKWENHWDPDVATIDSLLLQTGLDRDILRQIKQSLDDIHCISIMASTEPNQPYRIGFRRIALGMYSFLIFPQTLSPEQQAAINADQASILYTPRVVFCYGGGAVGTQHFVGKDEYLRDRQQRLQTL